MRYGISIVLLCTLIAFLWGVEKAKDEERVYDLILKDLESLDLGDLQFSVNKEPFGYYVAFEDNRFQIVQAVVGPTLDSAMYTVLEKGRSLLSASGLKRYISIEYTYGTNHLSRRDIRELVSKFEESAINGDRDGMALTSTELILNGVESLEQVLNLLLHDQAVVRKEASSVHNAIIRKWYGCTFGNPIVTEPTDEFLNTWETLGYYLPSFSDDEMRVVIENWRMWKYALEIPKFSDHSSN